MWTLVGCPIARRLKVEVLAGGRHRLAIVIVTIADTVVCAVILVVLSSSVVADV